MSTIPTTLIINITNTKMLPVNMAMVVLKQLFRYGVKQNVKKSEACILVYLKYNPKMVTLTKKFGNLPVKVTRAMAEHEKELGFLETAVKRFNFNIQDDDDVDAIPSPPPPKKLKASSSSSKEILPPPTRSLSPVIIEDFGEEENSQHPTYFQESQDFL
ncbi:uncharacterized protein [Leptinotarsa decemlineata]|uniref:uncharacterized protein n=1 Tax=Leptinotarsa decemlineata TaxID=7539 RepID=UPI003D30B549